jgi:predicted CXXCH cytochrome family protein
MRMPRVFPAQLGFAALVLIGMPSLLLLAGEWHAQESAVCSDCHTMHNSSGGAPMRYDNDPAPSPHLLRHATTLSLCTYCHDGTKASAPDVIAPISYVSDALGGSFPTTLGTATGTGHALATGSPLTPPGGTVSMVLTCVSCHDPHGNQSYRNLKLDPLGTGTANLVVSVKEQVMATGSNPAQVYVAGNVIDKGGMSAWCGACHGDFHGRTPSQEGTASPWFRHPEDQAISTSAHVDYTFWQGALPNRVRVESPSDDLVPSLDDRVFCLSCHKAHGSVNRSSLIFSDGARLTSTCQQCHNE